MPLSESTAHFAGGHERDEIEGLPRYLAAYNRILSAIQRGALKPGDQLPPEVELARALAVSLGTAQKALRMLSDRGLIVRQQGHGTFVAGGATPRNDKQLRNFRFLGDDNRTLLPIYTRVLAIEEVTDRETWSEIFTEEASVVHITRLVNVNFEFQLFSRLLLPASLFRSFLSFKPDDLDGTPLTYYLGERYNIPILRSVHRLLSVILPDEVCTQIGVPLGTLGTQWEIYGSTHRSLRASYQHIYMPPHKRQLELRDSLL